MIIFINNNLINYLILDNAFVNYTLQKYWSKILIFSNHLYFAQI